MTLDGREQRLEPRLAALLDTLVGRAGETISREELLDLVWADEGSDEALTQAISRLRQFLGNHELIRTLPREGYRLNTRPISVMPEGETRVAEQTEAASRTAPLPFPSKTSRAFIAGLLLGIVLTFAAFMAFGPEPVTITENVTAGPGQKPSTQTFICKGTPEECEEMRPQND